MLRVLEKFGAWSQRNWRRILFVFMVPPVIGIGADRLIGGDVAFYAGSVQFIALVLYFLWAFSALLLWPYGPKIARFTEFPPVVAFRVLLLVFAVGFAVFCVGFTLLRIASHES